jgi:glycosyltransferase involved in cell wall biosynthesis
MTNQPHRSISRSHQPPPRHRLPWEARISPATATPAASVVIPTYNRKDCLRQAIASAFTQTVPIEVIVLDDGSTDGTPDMVRSEFPQVTFEQHPGPNGPAFLRNRGSALARAQVLFPIDDDSVLASPHTIEQTLREFDEHPRVGAVGIPFINVRIDQDVRQRDESPTGIHCERAYVGAAHAVRRDLFLAFGGYRPQLFYMGEEGDFCARLLDHGYVVRLGRADPIHHLESPSRSLFRADTFGRRNDVLFAVHNIPMPYFPLHLLVTTYRGLIFGMKVRRFGRMARGLASGWAAIPREWRNRAPVSKDTYRLIRRMRHVPAIPLEEIEPLLGPIRPPVVSEQSMR